jgi:urea-proton symporter
MTFGGIKSTFITDWVHTVVIFVILLFTMFSVYATSHLIGSPAKMYELLNEVSQTWPSTGAEGSYLTMHNPTALLTGIIIMLGGFSVYVPFAVSISRSSVFGDPSYAQKAIAASPYSALAGYVAGGLCWMIIPWALGTSAGLAARALTTNPAFPTYPNVPLTFPNDSTNR